MQFGQPITEIVRKRFSCRTCAKKPIDRKTRQRLEAVLSSSQQGPLGTRARFELVAATETERQALKGLGTYGFIKDAPAFVVGAVFHGEKDLEDFGYLMEWIILFATDTGLGTCWLGGSFTKSRFAAKISLQESESMPAVTSIGYAADKPRRIDALIRVGVAADKRLAWDRLFFDGGFDRCLSHKRAGIYAAPLEMVQLAPSATNKQPWRIAREGNLWHFYLQRTPGYGKAFLGLATKPDLQRVDMGIAMCHFELTARELGLKGHWLVDEPGIARPDAQTEYIVSWVSQRSER